MLNERALGSAETKYQWNGSVCRIVKVVFFNTSTFLTVVMFPLKHVDFQFFFFIIYIELICFEFKLLRITQSSYQIMF